MSTQIQTPTPVTFAITTDMHYLFNQHALRTGHVEVTVEELIKQIPRVHKAVGGMTKVTVSCHCEVNLALYAATKFSSQNVVIGLSKGLCFLCEKFIEDFKLLTGFRVFVSENQGKVHAGWMLPENASDIMKRSMQRFVDSEICNLRHRIVSKRYEDPVLRALLWRKW